MITHLLARSLAGRLRQDSLLVFPVFLNDRQHFILHVNGGRGGERRSKLSIKGEGAFARVQASNGSYNKTLKLTMLAAFKLSRGPGCGELRLCSADACEHTRRVQNCPKTPEIIV